MRAPAIIIGIGGIGSDICARVERMLPQGAPDSDCFRFAVMDTDVNTLREIRRRGFNGATIQLSDNMTVNTCLEMLKKGKLAEWYPENGIFANKAMTEGAGQYRAVSRLAFEYAVQKAKLDELGRLIRELTEISLDNSNQHVRFYIISSLAGGTGSGIALPVALYINRLYMEEKKEALFSCKGFFLLSSALHEVGGKRLEADSIDANAYAAVKELSAYMRAADERGGRYARPEMEANGQVNVNAISGGKIYDYCYLFGMMNKGGWGMHSFEDLKNLVANAVYMQACSPMHDMNSSLEDNTIKHLIQLARKHQEMFLRRFGGIGCGELVYPYEEIKKYIAMRWAREMIETRWQEYDAVYYEKQREQEEKRKQGKKTAPLNQGEEYIRAVDNAVDDFLAEEIINVCCPDGEEPLWNQYMKAMYDKIAADIERDRQYQQRQGGTPINKCERELAALENTYNPRTQRRHARNFLCKELQNLVKATEDKNRKEADSYVKTWFIPHKTGGTLEPFHMEYWLFRGGQFMHPNTVRYFLYQLKAAVALAWEREKDLLEEKKTEIDKSQYFEEKEHASKRELKESHSKFSEVYHNIFEHAKHSIYMTILQRCQEYVGQLCEKYEQFYQSCDGMLEKFAQDCMEIEDELDRKRGLCLAYICADRECRDRLFSDIKNAPNYSQAGKGLSSYIYQMLQHPKSNKSMRMYEQFCGYWIDNLEAEFGSIINMDVLDALVKQEYYKYGRTLDAVGVEQSIQKAEEILIAPFLTYKDDCSHQQGISLCCYHEDLKEKNSLHREVINWIKGRRGVPDKHYCSPYQLMFYRSIVGLNASEIMEYLHMHCYDSVLDKGPAFRAYENNVRDIASGDNAGMNNFLTPHIDRNWHSYLEMPDTNRNYQEEMEVKTGVVFFYVCIMEKIKKDKDKDDYQLYVSREKDVVLEKTLEDCHAYLYQYPGAAHTFALELIGDVMRFESSGECDFLNKLKERKDDIFETYLRYYVEIDAKRYDTIPKWILQDSMAVLVMLYAKDVEDARNMLEQYLTGVIQRSQEDYIKGKSDYIERLIKNICNRAKEYFENLDVARMYNLCTRLFYTERVMLRNMMEEN